MLFLRGVDSVASQAEFAPADRAAGAPRDGPEPTGFGATPDALPTSLRTLFGRYDPSVLDVPRGGARIRLVVSGVGQWDVIASADAVRAVAPQAAV